jgi:hypothetical protein
MPDTNQIRANLVTTLSQAVTRHHTIGGGNAVTPFRSPDGRTFKMRVRALPDVTLADGDDWYGTLEWTNGPHDERPAGFDGRACVIARGKAFERCWWQPPADVAGSFELDQIRQKVRAYFANEWHHLAVEIREDRRECATCGHTPSASRSTEYYGLLSCEEFHQVYRIIDGLLREVNV